jgi:hypothetical protein
MLLLALLVALAVPAVAFADGNDVLRDCAQDGDLDRDYSDEELEEAYSNMPTDIDEYSNCREVIRQAQAGGRGSSDGEGDDGSSAGGTSGGGSDYRGSAAGDDLAPEEGTPEDQQELANRADAARSGNEPPTPSGSETASSNVGADDDSGLPAAALVAIVLLLLAAVGGALYVLRDRLPYGLTSRVPGLGSGQDR